MGGEVDSSIRISQRVFHHILDVLVENNKVLTEDEYMLYSSACELMTSYFKFVNSQFVKDREKDV